MKIFNAPFEEKLSKLYDVTVNGKDIPVFKCIVKSRQFTAANCESTHGTPETNKEEASFVIIDADKDEELHFEVTPKKNFTEVRIRPFSKGIDYGVKNGKICFKFKGQGQFTVEPEDHHGALHIFVNDASDYADVSKDSPDVIYFGPGYHDAGRIRIRSGQTVFIDFGAWVKGYFLEENISNFRIIGHGIVEKTDRYDVPVTGGITSMAMEMHFLCCSGILVDGITMLDSPMWVICINNCNNMIVNNIKQIGMFRGSSDGFDIVNSQNITLSNSFIRNGDDCVTLKGFMPFEKQNVENISVNRCVLWCDWGVALQIGAEACAEFYRNISFTDCDVIHEAQAVLSFQTGGYADVSNVLYDDIRVEYSKHARKPILCIGIDDDQVESDNMENYESHADAGTHFKGKKKYVDELFDTIKRPKAEFKDIDYNPPDEPFLCWLFHIEICEHWHDILAPDTPFANNHNIVAHNIRVYTDEGMHMPPSKVKGHSEISRTYDMTVSDLYLNGRKVETFEDANFEIGEFADNITIK